MNANADFHESHDVNSMASEFFNSDMEYLARGVDKFFSYLLVAQWAFVILLSYLVTPKTALGSGGESFVWTSVLVGGFLTFVPFLFNFLKPGWVVNRYFNVISQSCYSILIIYLTGGRIESHFHVFASFVLYALYFDLRLLILGSVFAILDHFFQGMWYPESLFGVGESSGFRWLEHVGWMVFESILLGYACVKSRAQIEFASFVRAEAQNNDSSRNHDDHKKEHNTESGGNLSNNFREHLENISAALSEITGMVEANVRSAENVNSVAGEVHGVSESTRHVMEELTSAMQNILESNVRIEKLVKIIEQVAEKTEVIDEIVFKTQLLSFNASVEAERAGEHGRGFAVVAQEVGNLAQMSGKAATEIASIVKNSIREADQVAAENKSRVERGGDLVAQTRERTSGVLNRITEILTATDHIVAASKEQSQGISEITKSINLLSQSSMDNHGSSHHLYKVS